MCQAYQKPATKATNAAMPSSTFHPLEEDVEAPPPPEYEPEDELLTLPEPPQFQHLLYWFLPKLFHSSTLPVPPHPLQRVLPAIFILV